MMVVTTVGEEEVTTGKILERYDGSTTGTIEGCCLVTVEVILDGIVEDIKGILDTVICNCGRNC